MKTAAPFVSPNNGAVGLNLKWTVFEFGKRRGQVSERQAQVAQAEENLVQVRRRVQVDVEKAVRKLNRAETALDSAKQLLASVTEARRVTSDRVEAGTANQSALLDAEAAISGAQADVLRPNTTVAWRLRISHGLRGPCDQPRPIHCAGACSSGWFSHRGLRIRSYHLCGPASASPSGPVGIRIKRT